MWSIGSLFFVLLESHSSAFLKKSPGLPILRPKVYYDYYVLWFVCSYLEKENRIN